jgi:predicted nucleic acid-binding protein
VLAASDAVISPLVEVEFCSLLSLKVRTAALNRAAAIAVLAQFRIHVADGLYRFVDSGPAEFELARGWLSRFDTPLRTLDALHLAMAFAHRQELITTDKILGRAAKKIGVPCRLVR